MTIDELRHAAMNAGGRVEKAGEYMLITVESPSPFRGTNYGYQRYFANADGTWTAG
ncbi:hypothetical protein [Streptomyces sp. NPDC091217]|uniref:hypothetical protein n=1 Tax=Streptomyces sp. NPDC091217 TaxID=3365975 RepID=UPI0037F2F8BD